MGIPTTVPAIITAGDTLAWTRSLPDYPASDGWTIGYRLINASAKIDITGSASGQDHAVSITATTSAAYAAGDYVYQEYVSKAGERHTTGTGAITIKPDLAAKSAAFEARGTWTKALADLRAALATWVTSNGAVAEYEIAGRRMKFTTAEDIRKRIVIAEHEAAREKADDKAASGQDLGRQVYLRFGRAR